MKVTAKVQGRRVTTKVALDATQAFVGSLLEDGASPHEISQCLVYTAVALRLQTGSRDQVITSVLLNICAASSDFQNGQSKLASDTLDSDFFNVDGVAIH